jgi:metal-responsive CopG/Arc/MetJ family transcriptional regulator
MKKKEAEIENLEDKKRYSMFLTSDFSNRLDELKNEKGFKHRSDVIIYLLNIALDLLEIYKKLKGNDENDIEI